MTDRWPDFICISAHYKYVMMMMMMMTDDRQTDHATEKCVAIGARAIPPNTTAR